MLKIFPYIIIFLILLLCGCSQSDVVVISVPTDTVTITQQQFESYEYTLGDRETCTKTNDMQICIIFSVQLEDDLLLFLKEQPVNQSITPFPLAPIRDQYLNYKTISFIGIDGEEIYVQQDKSLLFPPDLFPELQNTMIYRLPISKLQSIDHIELILPAIGYQKPITSQLLINLETLKEKKQVQLEQSLFIDNTEIKFTTAYFSGETLSPDGLSNSPARITILGLVEQNTSSKIVGLGREELGIAIVMDDKVSIIRNLSANQPNHEFSVSFGNAYIVQTGPIQLEGGLRFDDIDLLDRVNNYLLQPDDINNSNLDFPIYVQQTAGNKSDLALWSISCLLSRSECAQENKILYQSDFNFFSFVNANRTAAIIFDNTVEKILFLQFDTGQIEEIFDGPFEVIQAVWSPDSQFFAINHQLNSVEIFQIINSKAVRIDKFSVSKFGGLEGWNNSLGLIFSYFNDSNGSILASYRNHVITQLFEFSDSSYIRISPDGTQVFELSKDAVWSISLTGNERALEKFSPGVILWSPDNQKILNGLYLNDVCQWYVFENTEDIQQHILTTSTCSNILWIDNTHILVQDNNQIFLITISPLHIQQTLLPKELQNLRLITIY